MFGGCPNDLTEPPPEYTSDLLEIACDRDIECVHGNLVEVEEELNGKEIELDQVVDELVQVEDVLIETKDTLTEVENDLSETTKENKLLRNEIESLKRSKAEASAPQASEVVAAVKDAPKEAEKPLEVEDVAAEPKAAPTGRSFQATHYTAFCDTGCTGVTATGADVSSSIYHQGKRVIAVDPGVIPLGSIVTVTYSGGSSFQAIAADTGGRIKGNIIDILVADKSEAVNLGRQSVEVSIH